MTAVTQPAVNHGQERILKNTSYLTLAFIVQKFLSFFYFILIARALGATDLGLYDPVKSLIPISLILIDFSLSAVLTREIARQPDRATTYLGTVLGIKLISATALLLIAGFATNFSSLEPTTKAIIYLDGVIVALDTFTLTLFAVFRGIQNLKYEALGMILTQTLTVIVGLASLKFGGGLKGLFLAVLVGSIVNFTYVMTVFRRKLGFFPRISWNRRLAKTFLKMALPFAIAAILVKIFTYTDRFLLLTLAGQKYVGWYITGHKLTFALEFIPSAFAAAIYPAMSAYFVNSTKDLARTFERAMYYLILLAVPIGFAVFTLAEPLILRLYGPVFARSILPLQIMISGLLFIFLNFPVGAFLNAVNRQTLNTINMAIVVVVNVTLNLFLIRNFLEVGAAVATLISTVLLFSLGLRWVGRIISYDRRVLLIALGKSLFAGAVMAIVLGFLHGKIPLTLSAGIPGVGGYLSVMIYFAILGIAGFVVYVGLLVAMRAVGRRDIKLLFEAIRRKIV